MEQEQRQRLREARLQEQLRQQEPVSVIGGAVMVSLLEQMQIDKKVRKQEEERNKQRALSTQAAEHQQKINLEKRQQREAQLSQHCMQEEEAKKKMKRTDIEWRERQQFEQEKQDISREYEAKILKLEEQNELAKAEKKKKEMLRKNLRKADALFHKKLIIHGF